jgi:SPP1 gp7 family putative phage head morphogenesis protein
VNEIIYKGLENGKTARTIGKEVSALGGVTARRGKFIARDQLGTLYGEMTKRRQTALGVKKYIWRTKQDPSVRDEHRLLEGEIIEWSKGEPFKGLHPGEDYNCRCTAEMYIDESGDIFADIE